MIPMIACGGLLPHASYHIIMGAHSEKQWCSLLPRSITCSLCAVGWAELAKGGWWGANYFTMCCHMMPKPHLLWCVAVSDESVCYWHQQVFPAAFLLAAGAIWYTAVSQLLHAWCPWTCQQCWRHCLGDPCSPSTMLRLPQIEIETCFKGEILWILLIWLCIMWLLKGREHFIEGSFAKFLSKPSILGEGERTCQLFNKGLLQ